MGTHYAFINDAGVVVQLICGKLTESQLNLFLRDYRGLFGATSFVEVDDTVLVWIGGTYDPESGEFSPPPSPEPEPEIVEGTTNDDAPIE